MNRALRAATMGVLLLSPVALTACSAGQVTQTATQDRDKTGAMAQVGELTLRQVQIAFPRGGSYDEGDDAELQVAIVNSGVEGDTLLEVTGEGFSDAEIDAGTTGSTATGTSAGSSASSGLEIPADTAVYVGEDGDASITLNDLSESLTVGQYVELTLTFENAGEITVQATVANPDEALERDEAFDFHQEEGHGEAAEGESREAEHN